jgi:hypothetical protein
LYLKEKSIRSVLLIEGEKNVRNTEGGKKQDFEGRFLPPQYFCEKQGKMSKFTLFTLLFLVVDCEPTAIKQGNMDNQQVELAQLKVLNAQFIKNFFYSKCGCSQCPYS